ncbi:hypothetical protein [Corynebacterium glyciniphilum]|uniref:hypothetical protein n=1 Tax=Corynebacterium glyciniphilum TaxID=1404244 RepID=UPI003FD27718
MAWEPSYPGEFPTLGYGVIEWMERVLAAPDRAEYEPLRLYREQAEFLIKFYRLDPQTGKRKYTRAVLGRPRGWGKSPFAAAICAAEALGPVLFSHWDEDGRPVGKPWASVRTPTVQIAAVSEQQTGNTYEALLEMLRNGPATEFYPSLQPYDTMVVLPRGKIEQVTTSPRSVKGARAVFAVMDQTEEWVKSNHGVKLAQTMRSNAAKLGGAVMETPNAFIPGEGSVAESAAAFADLIKAGKARDDGLLYDHREAPADTDLADRDSLVSGLRVAYGDSSAHPGGCVIHDPPCAPGHSDLDSLIQTIWTPDQDAQQSRSDFLNQVTHASDSWVSSPQVQAIIDRDKIIKPGDRIVLGFDGSRGRVSGKADATALVGMRVEDRHIFEIAVWEPGPNDPQDWAPNPLQVDATVRDVFARFNVIGFYADPSGWTSQVAEWEAAFHNKLRVKASRNAPIAAWPRGKDSRVSEVVEKMRQAIVNGEVSMSDSPRLISHMLHARKRAKRTGYLLYKAYPESMDKIDAAYAACMAYSACIDAVAAGIGQKRQRKRSKAVFG